MQDGERAENWQSRPELWKIVFTKLPVKTLLQIRSVCKSWCTLIDSPAFILAHRRRFKNNVDNNLLLTMERIGPARRAFGLLIKVVDKFTFQETARISTVSKLCKIRGALDGLVLFQDCWNIPHCSMLRIWNPSVRKSFVLPSCPFEGDFKTMKFVMGYDSSRGDYKVVAFRRSDGIVQKLSSRIAVYSCNDHLWRVKTVEVNEPVSFITVLRQSVTYTFCQGAAHWVVSDGTQYEGGFMYTHVISFDFGVEEFRCVQLPGRNMFKCLFVFGKSLAVLGVTAGNSYLWVMRDDGGEDGQETEHGHPWVMHYFGDSSLEAYNLFQQNKFARISYDEYSKTFFVLASSFSETKLMSCNFRSRQIQTYVRIVNDRFWFLDTYVESLVLSRRFNNDQTLTSFP